jgi:hypothetical protein
MPGPTSPNTALYSLGRGVLTIAEWSGTTPPSAVDFESMGNCPKFEVEVTEEKLEHFSKQTGLKVKDKSVTLEIGYNLSFDLDEISAANLAKFVRGTLAADVISAATSLDAEFAITFTTDNPVGENEVWEFWRCSLSPGAAYNLISDEWSTLSFTAEGLADSANHAASPYFNVTWVTTTTT